MKVIKSVYDRIFSCSVQHKLLETLITLVTTDPTPNVMTIATGIPPHTIFIKDLNYFESKLHDLSLKVDNLCICLNNVLSDAIEKKMA